MQANYLRNSRFRNFEVGCDGGRIVMSQKEGNIFQRRKEDTEKENN